MAEPTAHRPFQAAQVFADLRVEPAGPAVRQEGPARVRRDREGGGHRQAQLVGHHGDVGRLASDERGDLGRRRVVRMVEREDVGHVFGL